jgi:hypothetical protein
LAGTIFETFKLLMVTNTRLDKAISGLKKILAQHQGFKDITIDNNQVFC